jgi:DNA polymerase I-like protein with 3'-5' exonuclease and polymerase domains
LARYDDGAYIKVVVEGKKEDETDVHSLTAKALGLKPKEVYTLGGKTGTGRDFAKTFIYAWLYGAGEEKLGSIIGEGAGAGRKMKAQLFAAIPGLKQLKHDVEMAARRGYLVGLDGRRIPVRSLHAALNTLLQGAGAAIMKMALVKLDWHLRIEKEWVPGKNYEFVLNVHDEYQLEADNSIADEIGNIGVNCIKAAGEEYGLRCPLDGEYKVGRNWAETH